MVAGATPMSIRSARSERARRNLVLGLGLGLPLVFLVVFGLFPLLEQGYSSFFSWYNFRPDHFVGFADYRQLFDDPNVPLSVLHTIVFVLVTVPAEVVIGLTGAWLTLHLSHWRTLFAIVFVIPLVVPYSSAATLFIGWFSVNGTVNQVLANAFGDHHATNPFADAHSAFLIVALLEVWKCSSWCWLLLVGALAASPTEVLEAGRVDGARGLRFWISVVLPTIRPMLIFVVVFRILAEAQTVSPVALLTQGGPYGGTLLSGFYAYTLGFSDFNFAAAAAFGTLIGMALLIVAVAGIAWIYGSPGRRLSSLLSLPGESVRTLGRGWNLLLRRSPVWSGSNSRTNGLASSTRWIERRRVAGALALALFVLLPFIGGFNEGVDQPDTGLGWSAISTALWNSIGLTAVTVVCTLALAIPAAWTLARVDFRLRQACFVLILVTLAIPGITLLLPQYQEIVWFGLINTRLGLLLLYTAANVPLAIFFLRPAFAAIPEELVEAMRIEGATLPLLIRRLFLPLAKSAVVAVSVLTIVQVWNELPLAVTLISSPSLFTLPVLIALNIGGTGSLGASWLSTLPPIVVFIVTQRSFRRGVLTGALL